MTWANNLMKFVQFLTVIYHNSFLFSHYCFELAAMAIQCYCFIDHINLVFYKLRGFRKSAVIQIYNELQLLVTVYNNIHKGLVTCVSTAFVSTIQVIALHLLITNYDKFILPFLVVICACVFDATIVMLESDGAIKSQLYERSANFLISAKRLSYIMESPINRRILKSWRIMRVCINDTNYYEKTTPLELMNFNMSVTINLLML